MLSLYKDKNEKKDFATRFALEIAVGDYQGALRSIAALRELERADSPSRTPWVNTQYEIYARARANEAQGKIPVDRAYREAFQQRMGKLDDRPAALVVREISLVDADSMAPAIQVDLNKQKGKLTITRHRRGRPGERLRALAGVSGFPTAS